MSADEADANRLLALYRRFVGEPAEETDVYLGFGLFFGGIALGAAGFGVFLGSLAVPEGTGFFWQLREVAISLSAFGLPALLIGVVVLLPTDRRVSAAAALGATLCLVAVAVFVAVYPANWNVRGAVDYSAQGIAIYAAGLSILVAATGTALVGHHLERARPAASKSGAGTTGSGSGSTAGDPEGSLTEADVRRDIDEALDATEISWGGVERKRTTRRLKIDTGGTDEEVDRAALDTASATTARGGSVDDAVAGLKGLRGGDLEQDSSTGVDDQTAALRELKERRRVEAEATAEAGVLGRLKSRLRGE